MPVRPQIALGIRKKIMTISKRFELQENAVKVTFV